MALASATASAGILEAHGLGGVLAPNGLLPTDKSRQPTLSPAEAARIAQERNGGGRVLSVDRGGDGYRVKLLKNGDVRVVYVPGE